MTENRTRSGFVGNRVLVIASEKVIEEIGGFFVNYEKKLNLNENNYP